jgi:hypothetical protein
MKRYLTAAPLLVAKRGVKNSAAIAIRYGRQTFSTRNQKSDRRP